MYSAWLFAQILMPQIPPGGIPGNVGTSNQFPQFGLRTSDGNIIEARNNAEKITDLSQGYVEWFSSKADAQSAFKGQQGFFGSGSPPGLSGLAAIGDFFGRLTEANTWIRVGEFVAGALLLYIGLKAVVAPEGKQVASRTAKQTARSIVEHTTPTGRVERRIRRHK